MGFRFRRSVKLLPGIRLNYGLGRSSLSVGGRGATLNLSSRGARATFGIPGTGLSWTTSSGSNRARAGSQGLTQRQPAAQRRQEQKLLLQAQAQAQVEAAEDERNNLLNCWHEMPSVPGRADYERACVEQPFDGQAVSDLNEGREREQFWQQIEARVRKERRKGWYLRLVLTPLAFPCVFGGVGTALQSSTRAWSILIGLAAYVGLVAFVIVRWRRGTQLLPTQRFQEEWPGHWQSVQEASAEYASWPERERQRVEWARKLLAGDMEALEEAVASSLEDLDFPFETQCRVAVPDTRQAYLLLDLPEIEDVIPEVRQRALKNGTAKEVRRTKVERNEDYLQLVSGLALLMTRSAFAAGPTLQRVSIAAYTQRRQRGSGAVADEYVYEAVFEREAVASWASASVDPLKVLNAPGNRLDLRDNGELKRIEAPSWVEGMIATS